MLEPFVGVCSEDMHVFFPLLSKIYDKMQFQQIKSKFHHLGEAQALPALASFLTRFLLFQATGFPSGIIR